MSTLTAARIQSLIDELAWSDESTFSIERLNRDMQPLTDSIRRRNKVIRDTLLHASLSDVAVETRESAT